MTTKHTEEYLGTIRFFREFDRSNFPSKDGSVSWKRGYRKAQKLTGTNALGMPLVVAFERDTDGESRAFFWKIKMRHYQLLDIFKPVPGDRTRQDWVRAHEWAHGPHGARFEELVDEGRGRDGGLKHVPEETSDLMNPGLDYYNDTDARNILGAYREMVEEGNVDRIYRGLPL